MIMIEFELNGAPSQIEAGQTIADLIAREGLENRRIAVEVNLEIIPRSQHATRGITTGDRIEIVHAIGGGQET